MTVAAIILATLVAGIGSVWLAAALMRLGFLDSSGGSAGRIGPQHLLSLAAGALLATAFVHLLPEAFESRIGVKALFSALLIGIVFFFLLDKAELWHHGHEHHAHEHHRALESAEHEQEHEHRHEHGRSQPHDPGHHRHLATSRAGGWAVLTGDSVHCFGDGILIASAFLAELRLGLVAAVAVLAHEVPHHIGDLVVLRHTGTTRQWALVKVSLAGAGTALGGLVGWLLVESLRGYLPYFLVVASSSFVYVALADLIPQLQRQLSARQTAAQIVWLVVGIALVTAVSSMAH
jgi:zinc and cadmium transporter